MSSYIVLKRVASLIILCLLERAEVIIERAREGEIILVLSALSKKLDPKPATPSGELTFQQRAV